MPDHVADERGGRREVGIAWWRLEPRHVHQGGKEASQSQCRSAPYPLLQGPRRLLLRPDPATDRRGGQQPQLLSRARWECRRSVLLTLVPDLANGYRARSSCPTLL